MLDNEKDKFVTMLQATMTLYDRELSKAVVFLWWEALKQFDFMALREAFSRYVTNPDNGQFAPKPADIIKFIAGTSSDTALVAWTKVEKAIGRVGAYSSVVFDDGIIQGVIYEMGGWTSMCHKNIDELPFVAKEFQQRYRHYKSMGKIPNYPKILIGLAEADNQLQGYKSELPVLIGDQQSAIMIMNNGNEPKQKTLSVVTI